MDGANFNFFFPTLNACLNGLASVFLLVGFVQIKRRQIEAHKKTMFVAIATSAAFLSSYLWYHFHYDSPRFEAQGLIRTLYFSILISHVVLAALQLPFQIWLFWAAFTKRYALHAKIGRWLWPVWFYVSVTGVTVYLMLYQWFVPSALQQFLTNYGS